MRKTPLQGCRDIMDWRIVLFVKYPVSLNTSWTIVFLFKDPGSTMNYKGLLYLLSLTAPSFFSSPAQLFSIVIFGCIANEGYINRPNEVEEYCIFNRNQNACNYGVFMGSMDFLCCLAFLALDIYFPQISSVKDRKKAVLADIGVSGKDMQKWQNCAKVFFTDRCKKKSAWDNYYP